MKHHFLKRVLLRLLKITPGLFPDGLFLKIYYRLNMGRGLNLTKPVSFNEKLNWLKLYDRNPQYTELVDKYSVKQYVKLTIGNKYVIPTIGVWDNLDDIEWDSLPQQFVLKTTHGGGNSGVVICQDKSQFDRNLAIVKLSKSLNSDLYRSSREWPYKNVKKRIIAEPYIIDDETNELRDYKFFCFDGEVKFLFIASERQTRPEPYFDFFDADFNSLPIRQGHPNSEKKPQKPKSFEEMKMIASKLSKGFPHVRVDLYEVNGSVLFGELTFYHFGGVVPFEPEMWDYKFGEYLHLPTTVNK